MGARGPSAALSAICDRHFQQQTIPLLVLGTERSCPCEVRDYMRLEQHVGRSWVILLTVSGSVLIKANGVHCSISIFSLLLLQNCTLGEEAANSSLVSRFGFTTQFWSMRHKWMSERF